MSHVVYLSTSHCSCHANITVFLCVYRNKKNKIKYTREKKYRALRVFRLTRVLVCGSLFFFFLHLFLFFCFSSRRSSVTVNWSADEVPLEKKEYAMVPEIERERERAWKGRRYIKAHLCRLGYIFHPSALSIIPIPSRGYHHARLFVAPRFPFWPFIFLSLVFLYAFLLSSSLFCR